MKNKKKELVGLKFGKLLVIEEATSRGKHFYWKVLCDCGTIVEKATTSLIHAKEIVHCGCLTKQRLSEALKGKPQKHGQTINGKWTPEYRIYRAMISRCTNPNVKAYKDYGGRGITIDSRWLIGEGINDGFECFNEDMGSRPDGMSLDRIDFNGNYSLENCRWADSKMQARNTRSVKLNMEKAREIRKKFESGEYTKSCIATEYTISRTTVRDIIMGKIWNE